MVKLDPSYTPHAQIRNTLINNCAAVIEQISNENNPKQIQKQ